MSRASSGHFSDETNTTQSKTRSLSRRAKTREDSNRSKDLDLNQLKSATRTASQLDTDVEELETSRFNHAVDELSAEMSRLTTDLVTETGYRLQLITLLHRQSAALSYCEQLLGKSDESRPPSSDSLDLISLLRSTASRSLGRTELGNELLPVLNDATLEPAAKFPKLFETLKSFFDRQSTQINNAKRRLTIYLSNLLRFLEQLANSRDIQGWLIDSSREEDYRPLLLSQVGRLDDLLRKCALPSDSVPIAESFTQLPDLLQKLIKTADPDPRELLTVIQLLAFVNEVSRKFVDKLLKQNEALQADRRQLQRELLDQEGAGEALAKQIGDATRGKIDRLKAKLQDKDRALKQAIRLLRQDGNSDEALRLLSGEITVTDADRSLESLANALKSAEASRDAALAESTALAERLETQTQELERSDRDRAELREHLDSGNQAIEALRHQVAQLTKEKQKLEQAHAELRKSASQQAEKMRADQQFHQTQLVEAQQQHEQEVAERAARLRDERKESEARLIGEAKQRQKRANARIRDLHARLKAESQRSEELQSSLDSLAEQLAREEAEKQNALKETQRQKLIVDDLKKDIASAQVGHRMVLLKLQKAEDQLKRERSLAETQSQLNGIGLEAAHQALLSEQKSAFDAKYRALLESVHERFADLVDFGRTISEESIQAGLEKVDGIIRSGRLGADELDGIRAEMEAVRGLVGVSDDTPIVPVVTEVMKKVAIGWEDWAQRVHALVTNSFSLIKTSEELQFALEEALMGSVRQNQLVRRLEVLRFEKKLLVGGRIPLRGGQRKSQPTFLAVMSVVAAARKLQKLTGVLSGGISRIEQDIL